MFLPAPAVSYMPAPGLSYMPAPFLATLAFGYIPTPCPCSQLPRCFRSSIRALMPVLLVFFPRRCLFFFASLHHETFSCFLEGLVEKLHYLFVAFSKHDDVFCAAPRASLRSALVGQKKHCFVKEQTKLQFSTVLKKTLQVSRT